MFFCAAEVLIPIVDNYKVHRTTSLIFGNILIKILLIYSVVIFGVVEIMININKPDGNEHLPNPTDEDRHYLLKNSLVEAGRPEDYENIVELLSPPPDITSYAQAGSFKKARVAVVGGGLAGMSAAFELRKLGFDITVFEANDKRLGGRVYTHYFDSEGKLHGELGAMRIPISHETSWHYINLFKLNTFPFVQIDPNTFIYVRGKRVRRGEKGANVVKSIYPQYELTQRERDTPWPELYFQVVKHYLSTLTPEIRKQFLMILPRYNTRYEELTNMSEHQAMQMYGLSNEAINMIEGIISISGALTNNSYETTLSHEYTMDFANLYGIEGGMAKLPFAFYKSLTSKDPGEYGGIPRESLGQVTWMGGAYVTGMHKSDRDGRLILGYRRGAGNKVTYDSFDYGICAVPMSILREAEIRPHFSGEKMNAINRIRYVDAQKTLYLCKERFWEKQGIKGGSSTTDEIIQMIGYPSDHSFCTPETAGCSPEEPGVLLASYNIDQDAVRLGNMLPIMRYRVINRLVGEIHGLPKGYLDDMILDSKTVDWNREMWAQGGFCYFLPGQKRDFLYVATLPEYDNRVFFAGEHVSTKNAWVQGALQSGMQAANNLAYHAARRMEI